MSASSEIYSIKQELYSIINELESISAGVGSDFEGIGNEKCALSLNNLADHYRDVIGKLNHIDVTNVKEDK